MDKILEILERLRLTGSTKDKQIILNENADNELLKTILLFTYDPFKKYGVSEKILDKILPEAIEDDLPTEDDLFLFLKRVANSNINNELRKQIAAFIKFYEPKYSELYKMIFLKDLKAGISSSTINKVWKNLIPKFDVQLAKKYWDVNLDENELIFITEKLDGIRCVMIKENDDIKFFTRQGKEIIGLNEIEERVRQLMPRDGVLDGELLADCDIRDSGEKYRVTVERVNCKSNNKTGINFCVFDYISLDDFKSGIGSLKYNSRRSFLQEFLPDSGVVQLVPLIYYGNDHSCVKEALKMAENEGKEGVMVNRNKVYECKRTSSILKVKSMQTVDLKIIDYKEGTGRNKGTLGAFVVDYKGNSVDVGSGFLDSERISFWNDRDNLIGRVIEVQYFEETANKQGGISLRFPVFKELREIGKEVSYN